MSNFPKSRISADNNFFFFMSHHLISTLTYPPINFKSVIQAIQKSYIWHAPDLWNAFLTELYGNVTALNILYYYLLLFWSPHKIQHKFLSFDSKLTFPDNFILIILFLFYLLNLILELIMSMFLNSILFLIYFLFTIRIYYTNSTFILQYVIQCYITCFTYKHKLLTMKPAHPFIELWKL